MEYSPYKEAPNRVVFRSYFLRISNALSGVSSDFATPKGHLIDALIDYSTVNKKFFTSEELKMLQKFFQHTVAHTPAMEKRHQELFDCAWLDEKVTSGDLYQFFCNSAF